MNKRQPRGVRKDPFPIAPADDDEEIAGLLSETIDSLTATVAGWRAEMARSAERAARLETSIAALAGTIEGWKVDTSRSDTRTEEKLVKALEILETSRAQSQSSVAEVRESLTSSASVLAKAIEEWRGEIRFGFGLTEVKLLGAIESMGEQVGQLRGSLEERKAALGESTAKTETRLLRVLEALDEGVSNTERLTAAMREQIGETATELSSALAGSGETLRGLISQLGATIQEWHSQVGAAASSTETKLLLSLEALESGIDHSLTARQHVENKVLASLEEMEHRLTRSEEENQSRQQLLEGALSALGSQVEEWRNDALAARETAFGQDFQNRVFMRLEELGIKMSRSQLEGDERHERLESAIANLALGAGSAAGGSAGVEMLSARLDQLDASVAETREVSDERQERLENILAETLGALQHGGTGQEVHLSFAGSKDMERVVMSLDELGSRISHVQAEASERQKRLEGSLRALAHSVEEWRTRGSEEGHGRFETLQTSVTSLQQIVEQWRVAGLEEGEDRHQRLEGSLNDLSQALEQWRTEGTPAPEGPVPYFQIDSVLESIGALGERLSLSDDRQHRIEVAIALLEQSIEDWRSKGRDAAARNKELLSQSLEALETRVVKIQDNDSANYDRLRREIAALTEATNRSRPTSKGNNQVMRGLEELDQSLLQSRDDIATIAERLDRRIDRLSETLANRLDQIARAVDRGKSGVAETPRVLRSRSDLPAGENRPSKISRAGGTADESGQPGRQDRRKKGEPGRKLL